MMLSYADKSWFSEASSARTVDNYLEHDWNAMKRTPQSSGLSFFIKFGCLAKKDFEWRYAEHGIQAGTLVVVRVDVLQQILHNLHACNCILR